LQVVEQVSQVQVDWVEVDEQLQGDDEQEGQDDDEVEIDDGVEMVVVL
jgi:hypothetical protein